MSPELLALAAEEIGTMRRHWRVEGAVDAAFSALRALTVDEARTRAVLLAIRAPTLLLWGANDRVIPRRLIVDVETAHPSWRSRTIDGVGHVLPWEAPGLYVDLACCQPHTTRGHAVSDGEAHSPPGRHASRAD